MISNIKEGKTYVEQKRPGNKLRDQKGNRQLVVDKGESKVLGYNPF